jgi:hypothetical protein
MHLALLISRIRLLPTAMPSTRSASASRLLVRADNSPGEVKARFSAPFVSAYLSPLFSAPLLSSKFRSALLCYLLHQLLQRINFVVLLMSGGECHLMLIICCMHGQDTRI